MRKSLFAFPTPPFLPPTIGVNWVTRYIQRRSELQTRYSKRYDYQRAQNEDPAGLREWFRLVQSVIEENGILDNNIYNFDETGFAMGLISTARVVTRRDFYGWKPFLRE
jgi:hypothetical protein